MAMLTSFLALKIKFSIEAVQINTLQYAFHLIVFMGAGPTCLGYLSTSLRAGPQVATCVYCTQSASHQFVLLHMEIRYVGFCDVCMYTSRIMTGYAVSMCISLALARARSNAYGQVPVHRARVLRALYPTRMCF